MPKSRICSIDGCGKTVHCKNVCKTHYHRAYMRVLRSKQPPKTRKPRPKLPRGLCRVVDCGKQVAIHKHGLCSVHYSRWIKTGDPNTAPQFVRGAAKDFLHDVAVKYAGDDCLVWPFYRTPQGYGKIGFGTRLFNVHRIVCRLAHGEPTASKPNALHSCGNGHLGCCNPRHLYWGTQKENMADAMRHGRMKRRKITEI
jgi:hypothetical protein